jgi:hypothetical protein
MSRCQGCGWPQSSPCPGRTLCADGFGIDIPPFLRRPPESAQARAARQRRTEKMWETRFIEHKRTTKRRPWHWPKGADCKTPEGRTIIEMIRGLEKDKERAQAERFKKLKEEHGR